MPFCSNCGNTLKAGSKFCSKCGAQLSAPGSGACPVCQKPVSGNEKFCVHCGASIGSTVNGPASAPPPPAAPTAGYPQNTIPPAPPSYNAPPAAPPVKRKKKGGCFRKTLLLIVLLAVAGLTALYFLGDDPPIPGQDEGGLTGTDIPGIVSVDDSSSNETVTEIPVETGDPQQAAETVEEAFARADTSLLKQMLTPHSQEIYKDAFREIKPYMSEYSKAFKNRKLKVSTPIYALYEFTGDDGQKYTAEFALSDDGQWKLVRF